MRWILAEISVIAFLALSDAVCADPLSDVAFQMRLVSDGVFDGPTDGHIGPVTRRALTAYSKKFGVENNRKAVEADMLRRAAIHRGDFVSDKLWALVTNGSDSALADPFSAKFKRLYYFNSSKAGNVAVCGLVNAKNSYGAYVGDQWFISLVIGGESSLLNGVMTLEAQQMCEFGVTLDDFRK